MCSSSFLCAFLSLSLLTAVAESVFGESGRKPNVVLILVDDMGWADLGFTGSTFHETPNINRLASAGAFFTNAYAASPICSPTRASILTGKYPSRFGLTNHSGTSGPKGSGYQLEPPKPSGNMPLQEITLAESLKNAGYTTAHLGKWHLAPHVAKDRRHYPEKNGFDINIAGHKMGQPGTYYFPYQSKQHPSTNVPDLADGKEGDYLTDVLTDKAIDFVKENKDKPFFLNLWYYTVHTPLQGRKDKLKKYRAKARELGFDKSAVASIPEHDSFSDPRQDDATYAAMVESMDENVGRLLKSIKDLGLEDETIVIFLSDNGGLSTGKSKTFATSNLPLRAGKAWVYEGGIRVPMVIKLPGDVKSGLKIDVPVVSTDIYPTVLDLAGLELKPEQHVDGVSLKSLATQTVDDLDREAIYFHYPHYHHINSMGPSGAVRMGRYKLVERYETGETELYDIVSDIGEKNDLSDADPGRAAKMKLMLHNWIEDTGSPMVKVKPTKTE